jgi:hypothetical protein
MLLADTVRGDKDIIAALGASAKTVVRVRKRFVTEGIEVALDSKPWPTWSDKIKIKGDVEQKLVKLTGTEPPQRRCHLDTAIAR